MVVDHRTQGEKDKRYPPGPQTMVRKCTEFLCGTPNEGLFDLIDQEMLSFLNQSNLEGIDILRAFHDIAGSFDDPSIYMHPTGRFLEFFTYYRPTLDHNTAEALANSKPKNWVDVMRVENIGPDTYYDIFCCTLLTYVYKHGKCLCSFLWSRGYGIDDEYFALETPTSKSDLVKIIKGIPYNVETEDIYIFKELGNYTFKFANPNKDFKDSTIIYKTADLQAQTTVIKVVNIEPARLLQKVKFQSNNLIVYCDPRFSKIGLFKQRSSYPSGFYKDILQNKNGERCTDVPCEDFSFIDQAELEYPIKRGIIKSEKSFYVEFNDVPSDKYMVAGFSKEGDKDFITTTVRNIEIDSNSAEEVSLYHHAYISRRDESLPSRVFLRGDIVRQNQGSSRFCGPFSLAHALSYWAPFIFNPKRKNGRWVGTSFRDSTFLGDLLGGVDLIPGTLQETLVTAARALGFHGGSHIYDVGKVRALKKLKEWIYAGIPVIVAIDEYMQEGPPYGAEHYKVLIGYDDEKTLDFEKDDGTNGTHKGTFYFINSGARGESREDPSHLETKMREMVKRNGKWECHPDYINVSIGNDVDAYDIFWQKWKTGGIPGFNDDYWCFPIYPRDWEIIKKFE